MKREKLSSRLGFILISAGCAIGLGNVWRFPYIVGEYGRRRLRTYLSSFPCDSRSSDYDNGIFSRTGKSGQRCLIL